MYSFSYLEPVCCSMSSSNCCFLTCIQVSQEAGQVVWYSHLFQNFPQFIVIHTVKGFGIVNKAEIGLYSVQFSSVQFSRSAMSRLSATPWIAAHQASLSITNSQSLLRLISMIHTVKCFTIVNKAEIGLYSVQFSSVQSRPDSLRPHESQHTKPPCPSPTPVVYSDSFPWSTQSKALA